jgi:hypothetical protein
MAGWLERFGFWMVVLACTTVFGSLRGVAEESSLSKVAFTFSDTASIDPAGPPADGAGVSALKISFTVKIDKSESTAFAYDPASWVVGFQNASGSGEIFESGTVTSLGAKSAASGNVYTETVSLQVTFASGTLHETIRGMLNSAETSSGRRSVIIVPIYRINDDKNTQKAGEKKYLWAADVGVIRGAAEMLAPKPSDESMVLRWRKPADLAAMVPTNGALVETGTSSVSGYLVVYWNQDECAANGAGWAFRGNPTLDSGTEGGREFTCSYGDSPAAASTGKVSTGQCGFGCATSAESDLSGKTLEEASVPFVIPSYGEAGTVFDAGCYKVVRIHATGASEETYAIADLRNGDRYGAVVYPLDSSGHVGLNRSGCGYGIPVKVPLPGEGVDGVKRSDSDCFVVTAASGDANSPTVNRWRLIRDHLLGRGAFTSWYYRNGPTMARWLDAHPWLKDATHSTLSVVGDLVWSIRDGWRDLKMHMSGVWRRVVALSASLLVSEAYADEPRKIGAGEGEVGANLQVLGGLTQFSEDTKTWTAYSKLGGKATKPYRLFLGYGYSVVESSLGELGLGAGFSYLSVMGEVPKRLPNGTTPAADAVGKDIVTYGYGGYGFVDYRLKIPHVPWVSPRVLVGGGIERMRTEARADAEVMSSATPSFPRGITLNKKMVLVRAGLETYLGWLFVQDISSARMGLGVQDIGLVVYYDLHKDLTDKGISFAGSTLGGGFSFLLL